MGLGESSISSMDFMQDVYLSPLFSNFSWAKGIDVSDAVGVPVLSYTTYTLVLALDLPKILESIYFLILKLKYVHYFLESAK